MHRFSQISRKVHLQSNPSSSIDNMTPLSPIQRLQQQIGNQATQRFIRRLIQREEDPTHQAGDISFDDDTVEVDPQFLSRAERVNKKYAQNPPFPGWPYRPDLKALWNAGQFAEFAFQVREFQVSGMNLDVNDKNADGILGKGTAQALRSVPDASNPDVEPAPAGETSAPVGANPKNTADIPSTGESANTQDVVIPDVGAEASSVRTIIEPLAKLYKRYEDLNMSLRTSYNQFLDNDKAIAELRWKMIRLKHLSTEKTLSKNDKKALETLQAENAKSPFTNQMETLQKTRESIPISKKNPESAVEAFRKKNPDRIKAERALVTGIADARKKIAGLGDPEMRATAYIELNKYTPYHYQIENIDVLFNSGSAGGRTCNVTSVSMVLESLGKNPGDYKGKDAEGFDAERMKAIAAQFETTIKDRGEDTESTNLRMPDFMQLVAIDLCLNGKPITPDNVASARFEATDAILTSKFLARILASFGAKTEGHSHKDGDLLSIFGSITSKAGNRSDKEAGMSDDEKQKATKAQQDTGQLYASTVSLISAPLKTLKEIKPDISVTDLKTILKSAMESIKSVQKANASSKTVKHEVFSEVLGSLNAALKALDDKKSPDDKKRDKSLNRINEASQAAAAFSAGGSLEAMQTVVSVDDYKAGFVPNVSKAMKEGGQVVLNLYNHFVRLQSIEDDGFVVDDPGRYKSESLHVSWAKGIADGYFRSYTIVRP